MFAEIKISVDASSILIPIYQAFSPSTSRLAHQIDLIRHIINTVPSTTQLERQLQWPRRRICNTVPPSHGKGENILNAYVSTHSTFFESWYLPFVYQLVSLGRFDQQTTTICKVTMVRRKGLSHQHVSPCPYDDEGVLTSTNYSASVPRPPSCSASSTHLRIIRVVLERHHLRRRGIDKLYRGQQPESYQQGPERWRRQ